MFLGVSPVRRFNSTLLNVYVVRIVEAVERRWSVTPFSVHERHKSSRPDWTTFPLVNEKSSD